MEGQELRIGFIGLGKMGTPIARNIQEAGFPLTVYNRTVEKMQPFIEAGATPTGSPKEAAEQADVVFTSLAGDDSVINILGGDEGLLAGLGPGCIHTGLSTISPAAASKLAQLHGRHGSTYIAAPVLGRPDVAEAGRLRMLVAGDSDAISRCTRVLETFTELVLPVGSDHAVASAMKVCANYAIVSAIEIMGEIYTFGEKSGVDAPLLNMLIKTLFPLPALQEYADQIQSRNFEPGGFAMTGGLKDVELFIKAGRDVLVALPFASVIRDKMLMAIAEGMSDHDWSGIYEVTRRQAGLE